MSVESTRFARWFLCLLEFECDLVHNANNKHQVVDVLSYLRTTNAGTNPIVGDLPVTVSDTDSTDSSEARLEIDQQALAHVVKENDCFIEVQPIPSKTFHGIR